MPLPPRFDPRWLIIPALALMIALGYPRQVPVDGPFRTGMPATLSASPPPVVSPPDPPSSSSEPPAGTTAPTAAASGVPTSGVPTTGVPTTGGRAATAVPGGSRSGAPTPQLTGPGGGQAPRLADVSSPAAPQPAEPVPHATPRPAEPIAPAAPQPARRVPAAARDGWSWPLPEPITVTRPFRAPDHPYGPGHRGVDLRSAPGSQVRAARSGVVGFAGRVADRWVVTVVHSEATPGEHLSAPAGALARDSPVPGDAAPGGLEAGGTLPEDSVPGAREPDGAARGDMPSGALRTTYEPVRPLVRTGQPVAAGDPIGSLDAGHRGCSAPACLHWGLLDAAGYLDPLTLFRRVAPRLLPLAG